MSTTLSVRLPDELAHWLQANAKRTGRSQANIIKECLEKARKIEEKPFMRLAGSLEGPPTLSERKGFASE